MKVKISTDNFERFRMACEVTGADIIQSLRYGKTSLVVINVKKPSDLFELGKVNEGLTVGDVILEYNKPVKENIVTEPSSEVSFPIEDGKTKKGK